MPPKKQEEPEEEEPEEVGPPPTEEGNGKYIFPDGAVYGACLRCTTLCLLPLFQRAIGRRVASSERRCGGTGTGLTLMGNRVMRDSGRMMPCMGKEPSVTPPRRCMRAAGLRTSIRAVSYTHLRAHETPEHLVCRLLLEKKKKKHNKPILKSQKKYKINNI
eukprot:TRINITY_DN3708_c0_g1_i19.p1 TRINITY_DN3708_c0_g1~~TRINITY_DN3708_c0_g1_i19.p1  ORF type:complete len:161 (-),score=29.51 TRINITY_DN3708_c0_g1_i19:63-545(-)